MVSISIVMPVFNCEKYLSESIESILAQTFTDFEFIIINDGSTDDSPNILARYEKKDSRIKVIHQKNNQGIVVALNVGIENSKAEYIARMDSDDISLPQRLEFQIKYLTEHPHIGLVGCFAQTITDDGKINKKSLFSATSHFEIIWSLCFSNPIPHPGVMFRRKSIDKVNGYRNKYCHAEDYDLWVQLAREENFYIIPEILVLLRKHEKSITTIHYQESLQNSILISQNLLSQLFSTYVPNDLLNPLWIRQKKDKKLNINSAKFLLQLNNQFLLKYPLTENENTFIEQDTIKRLFGLLFFRSFSLETIEIFILLIKYNFALTLSFIFNKILVKNE